jgi:hypothetical protein
MDPRPDELLQQSARQMRYLTLRLLRLQQINDQLLAGLRELEALVAEPGEGENEA